jgi:hypothetical protein
MREIKFRAWSKEHKYMFDLDDKDFFINNNGVYVRHCIDYQGDVYENETDKFILMQYTGLKDKNGVEIYEGDVVAGQITGGDGHYEQGRIEWSNKKAGFVLRFKGLGWRNLAGLHKKQVIGNIHTNPELIKEQPCPQKPN